ncbi:hypothetical protein BCR33DRAFT_757418 [Rhizoclosmatium globosum]|uniref:poly(A)-specific ribonuclease n=1 Tax=Rhizoclosmatium globosum TaxID=329046 RepID=A0A1Y2CQQ9_9FUNG|nr:hypothetical protein BCR33DRAFT_757418 [Rhizoclosmatium globosum]|eukprot:ORY49370.1 hypothetical protein BCR33DRAFT_757418 [Rhizoclosmatium globosum]
MSNENGKHQRASARANSNGSSKAARPPSRTTTRESQRPRPEPPIQTQTLTQLPRLLSANQLRPPPRQRQRLGNSLASLLTLNTSSQSSNDDPKPSQWSALDLGGMHMRNIATNLFKYSFLTQLYLNHNQLHFLPPEVAHLKSLALLDLSANKLQTVPPELGQLVSLKELLLFDNQLTYLPVELGNLFQLDLFGLEGNPLSEPYIGFLQKEGGALHIISYLRENIPAGAQPAEREWIVLEDDEKDSFTVLCYNTLCDKYATAATYPYTPSWALAWEYRKETIFHEIINYNADIVCLQEMETGQFEEYFQEQFLQVSDYEGVFWPKSRARTMGEYERRAVDGCATFFRSSKFSLIEKHTIEFQQIAMQRPELRRTEDVFNRVMVKDNIGLITVLESKDAQNPFKLIVVNTHLHWDPSDGDVKLVQTAMLLEELAKIVAQYQPATPPGANKPKENTIPILLCGDFNSLPESGVHQLLTQGSIPRDHPDFQKYTYGSRHQLDFTNLTPSFKGVIDWIWYSGPTLGVSGDYLKGVGSTTGPVVGFPNAHHPSDHVPIMASLWYKGGSVGGGKDDKSGGKNEGGNFGGVGGSNKTKK